MTNTIQDTSQSGKSAAEKAKEAASTATQNLKAGARDVADTVSTEAANYADQARETAADEVKDVASALRTAARDLRSGSPQERTLSQIANGLADAAEAVRGKDLSEVVSDVNRFAKRNPLVFLGGAALIGFAATRFAKASSEISQTDGYEASMDRPVPSSPMSGQRTASHRPSTSAATSPMGGRT